MNKLITRAGVAALVAPFALAAGVLPAAAEPGAEITVNDCIVESSKDISYIAYYNDGRFIKKDESIGTQTYNLRNAEVENFTAIEVKSSTTKSEFPASGCDATPEGNTENEGGTEGTVDNGDDEKDSGNNGTNNGDKVGDDQAKGQEEADGQAGGSDGKTDNPGNSGTDIRLEGCEIISGKEISYVAFFDAEGDLITKNEAVNDETLDLSTVEFDFEEIEVKSGTTIELFDDECQTTDDTNGGSDGDGTVQDENGGDDTNDNGGPSDEGNDDDRGNNNDRGDDNRGNDRGDNDRGGNDRGDRDNDRGADNRGDRDNSNRGNGEVRGEQTINAGGAGAPAVDAEVLGVEETVAVPTEVAAGVSGAEALPQTGAEDKLVLFGAIGLGLLALGGAAMVIRRRLGSGI